MIAAPADELWELISDPNHLARWWPRVTRVEGVDGESFTEVMRTKRGRTVRADFRTTLADRSGGRLRWEQQVAGTPFARVLSAASTEIGLQADEAQTSVTIELRQSLSGLFPRMGALMVRRAGERTLDAALDGLERVSG
jgi:carbon monoxide dehydrogenase subunit G